MTTAARPDCLQFRMGNAQSPSSPWGRDELDVFADGRVTYRNQYGSQSRSLTARLPPAAVDQLFAALAASPFPASPDAQLMPGGSICELVAGERRMLFDYHTALKTPAYAPLVRMLTKWTNALRPPAAERGDLGDLTDLTEGTVSTVSTGAESRRE